MARSDPLKPPGEGRARGGGIAPLGSVPPGSVPSGSVPRESIPRESIQLQPVFGGARRRPALGGPLPFVAAAVVLGIIAVLVSGNRGEGPDEPGAIDPRAIERGAIERDVLEPGVLERDGSERGATGPGAKVPGAMERGVSEPGSTESGSVDGAAVEPEGEAPSSPPVAAAVAPAGVDTDRPGEEARALIATMRAPNAEEDLDTVFRKAGESLKLGRIADAHLLYFFAARRGHAPAAVVLAGIYDPVRFDKDRSLLGRPDPLQALKWYRVAASQGDGEAQARLRSLESWVDARARAGDAEAERLRLSWR
ncbi:MAG: hypothetical protein M3461_09475 [Pseudomonadota bacterium]|nr:hypothetical protein [Pseudomonadota bacterium]